MQTRLFSLGLGVVYVVIGALGFVSGLRTHPASHAPTLAHGDSAYGYLFGQFPVNTTHDVLNIVIGLIGIAVCVRLGAARAYSRLLFLVFGLFTIFGFMPVAGTLWGFAPIYGADVWVHAVSALAAAYFGFVATEPTYVEPAPGHFAHA
jgi:hypothetical protein